MRTITREYTLFTVAELTPEARERAYEKWQHNVHDYPWANDNQKTLDAFCSLFGVVCSHWEYNTVNFHFSMESQQRAEVDDLSDIRLMAYLYNNFSHGLFIPAVYRAKDYTKKRESRIFRNTDCPLTGYCMDYSILKPVYDFLVKPDRRNFRELMQACLNAFFHDCHKDYEYCNSLEYFEQHSEANNYEYLADGTPFS